MKKAQPGKFTALVLCACCLAANLTNLALAQDGSTTNGGRTWTADPSSTGSSTTTTPAATTPAGTSPAGATPAGTTNPLLAPDSPFAPDPATTSVVAPKALPNNTAPAARPAQPAARPAAVQSRPAANNGPVHGRIEELCTQPGAILPLKALTAKMDTSKPMMLKGEVKESVAGARAAAQSGGITQGVVQQSFPIDYSGQWGGSMKVWTAQYGPLSWEFDPDETRQELALLKPGTEGSVSFSFAPDPKGRVFVEPTQVVFSANKTISTSQLAGQLGGGGGNAQANALAQMLGGGSGTVAIPTMYAMHLGNLASGVGVTGNFLQSRVAKNEIRELKPGVLEQTIVTRDSDTNTKTGKNRQTYSESVLRFTRVNPTQLYVQAATVKYSTAGKYENKVVLYGTVNRGQGGAGLGGMLPGLGGMGGGGMPGLGGAGGMGGLEQMFREMNKQLGGQ